jgi:hypothetical protein
MDAKDHSRLTVSLALIKKVGDSGLERVKPAIFAVAAFCGIKAGIAWDIGRLRSYRDRARASQRPV